MEKEYFIDTLFDLINESDALEADLQDVSTDRESITITMQHRFFRQPAEAALYGRYGYGAELH